MVVGADYGDVARLKPGMPPHFSHFRPENVSTQQGPPERVHSGVAGDGAGEDAAPMLNLTAHIASSAQCIEALLSLLLRRSLFGIGIRKKADKFAGYRLVYAGVSPPLRKINDIVSERHEWNPPFRSLVDYRSRRRPSGRQGSPRQVPNVF